MVEVMVAEVSSHQQGEGVMCCADNDGKVGQEDVSMCDKFDNTIGPATIYTCTRPAIRSQGVRHVVYQVSTGRTLDSEKLGG